MFPPKEEQKVISNVIDQLMAICDELEKKLIAKSSRADSFCESALATFAFGL
jgi:restriction endonuclease S subunit